MNVSLINGAPGYEKLNLSEFLSVEEDKCNSILLSNVLCGFPKSQIELIINHAAKIIKSGGEVIVEQNDLHEAAVFLISGRLSQDQFNDMFVSGKEYVPSLQYIENLFIRNNLAINMKDLDSIKYIVRAGK